MLHPVICLQAGTGGGAFCEAGTLLCKEDCPGLNNLLSIADQHLSLICDVKQCEEDKFYRFNPEKVGYVLSTSIFG
jgi:hypothetical protein